MLEPCNLPLQKLGKSQLKMVAVVQPDSRFYCITDRFTVDSETADPIDVQTKEMRETNSMVEEFMLVSNET